MPVVLLLGVTACSASGPSESEILKALSGYTNAKGCATSVLFKTFPVKGSFAASNQGILDAFIHVGLIEKTGGEFAPTARGKAAYDPKVSGFCYTDHYLVKDVSVVKEEPKSSLPPALSGAWYVSFKIAPQSVADWAKDPQLLKEASLATVETVAGTQQFTVRMARKVGENKLIIADPRFSFTPGIHFNMGWSL
ncbi:acyltransferase [Parasulfuritortus cantonensis]|uniref:Acyltransferase n=1 Tax=Parasulfuritortus cantonensis TaxID=2528202 RepID=A0A4R1BD90_9PROT|nr:acyltransferase [Parasulfuritortus cantonensis]